VSGVIAWLAGSRVGRAVAAIGAMLAIAWYVYLTGKREERRARKLRDLTDHIETRRRMDDAVESVPDNVAAARGILLDRAKRGDGDL
jgi:hypothetical protein